jgi:hypothetical protein
MIGGLDMELLLMVIFGFMALTYCATMWFAYSCGRSSAYEEIRSRELKK